MQWIKRFRFTILAALIALVLGGSLYLVARWQQRATEPASARSDRPRSTSVAETDVSPTSRPRSLVLQLISQGESASVDGEKLAATLAELAPVQEASWKSGAVMLAVTGPLKLSELLKQLETHPISLVETEIPVRGAVRLHAAGMT